MFVTNGIEVQQAPNATENCDDELGAPSSENPSQLQTTGPINQIALVDGRDENSGESGKNKTSQKQGASLLDIENWLKLQDPETILVEKQLFLAVKREVEAGRLWKLPDNTYAIGDGVPLPKKISPAKQKKLQAQCSTNSHSHTATPKLSSAEVKSSNPREKDAVTLEKKVHKKVKSSMILIIFRPVQSRAFSFFTHVSMTILGLHSHHWHQRGPGILLAESRKGL